MRHLVLALAVGLFITTSSTGTAAQPEPSGAALCERGEEAALAGRWQRAYASFRRAHDVAPTAICTAELGRVELRLAMPRDAAEHLELALRQLPPKDTVTRAIVAAALADARKYVVSLSIRASVAGARIFVDDAEVGVAPLDHEVFVDEGAHGVEARLAGYRPASVAFLDRLGASREITLDLAPAPARPPVAPRPHAAPERPRVGPIILGGVLSGATLAAGIGFGAASARGASDQGALLVGMAASLSASAALASATVSYALIWQPPRPLVPAQAGRARIQLVPAGAHDGFGVILAGSF
jgi:hypothetical protein